MADAMIVASNEQICPCSWPFVNDLTDVTRRRGVRASIPMQVFQLLAQKDLKLKKYTQSTLAITQWTVFQQDKWTEVSLKNEQFKNAEVSHFSPLIYSVFPSTYIPYSDDEMINFQA